MLLLAILDILHEDILDVKDVGKTIKNDNHLKVETDAIKKIEETYPIEINNL